MKIVRVVPIQHTTDDGNIDDSIWEETPVDPDEFFEKFIGEPLFAGPQRDLVRNAFGNDPKEWSTEYDELQALWGKGSGKDRTSSKALCYAVYKLMCMKNPMEYLSAGAEKVPSIEDKLELGNVCINSKLAKEVFFKYFKIMVRSCKNPKTGRNWFVERGLNLRHNIKTRQIDFPKNITAHSLDSEEYTGEGLNLFFVIFDEVGGFDPKKASGLYDALVTSARSRFPKYMKIFLISYKRSDNDFMMLRFDQAAKEPQTYRSGPYATWEVNLKRVKEDFTKDYIRDPEGSKRTYECKGKTSEGGYFRYRSRISQVINGWMKDNPIVGDKISVMDLRNLQFKDWFDPAPNTVYFIHVDLAKGAKGGDRCGLAMGHYQRDMEVSLPPDFVQGVLINEGFDLSGAQGDKAVGAFMDLVLQIRAPAEGEIMFEEVRGLIENLARVKKFPIQLVTYDGWQSMDSIQLLRKAGVHAEEQSVDRDNEAYDTLKSLIYRGIFECYPHNILIRELEELTVTPKGKVDHPAHSSRRVLNEDGMNQGSKDIADAVAGCANLCIKFGKTSFQAWTSAIGKSIGSAQSLWKHPIRSESEKLVRYGEIPPEWYTKSIGS